METNDSHIRESNVKDDPVKNCRREKILYFIKWPGFPLFTFWCVYNVFPRDVSRLTFLPYIFRFLKEFFDTTRGERSDATTSAETYPQSTHFGREMKYTKAEEPLVCLRYTRWKSARLLPLCFSYALMHPADSTYTLHSYWDRANKKVIKLL